MTKFKFGGRGNESVSLFSPWQVYGIIERKMAICNILAKETWLSSSPSVS